MGIEDSALRRYLLGDLPEPERERLEEQYFAKDEVWEGLNTAEQELIDDYVRGDLPARERQQFENYFLDSPRKRQKLEFAKVLLSMELRNAAADSGSEERQEWSGYGWVGFARGGWPVLKLFLATGAVALAAAALFFALQQRRLQDEFHVQKGNGTETIARGPTPEPTIGYSNDTMGQLTPADSSVLSVVLTSGAVRDASGGSHLRRLMLSDAVETVVLYLSLEEDSYPRYNVVIRSAEGREIERQEGIKSHATRNSGRVVSVKLSSQRLPRGDYIVKLSGKSLPGDLQEVDSYTFSVIR